MSERIELEKRERETNRTREKKFSGMSHTKDGSPLISFQRHE